MALRPHPASIAVLALAFAALSAAQDLSEAASREKKRRETVRAHGPTRSFSDENLKAKASGWQWFGGPDYGFHALFPTAPRVEDEVDLVGAIRVPRRRYVASSAGYAYSVLAKARPKDAGLSDEALLNRLQAEARVDAAGEILASSRVAGQPCPGVEFRVRTQRAGRERILLQRAFACSRQLLTVAAECCATDGSEREVESAAATEAASEADTPTPAASAPDESTATHFLDYFVLETP